MQFLSANDPRKKKERLAAALYERAKREERLILEGSLSTFVKAAWSSIDSSEYQESWALDALCDHLEAVTRGHIKRLLINFPPRCGKSNVTSIAWPVWVWAQSQTSFVSGPNVQFLCGSYNHTLALQHSNKARRLLQSPFFQHYWGDRFKLLADQNSKGQYDTDHGGSRIATSVGGSLIGIGGSVILVDDPHNTESVESEAERETVMRWWTELSSTRLNDPNLTAIVVVMQRLHEKDVTGNILEKSSQDWTHLMLPMRYVPNRHCITRLSPTRLWEDPRHETRQELLWPERYDEKQVKRLEADLGPYMASGRLQQRPTPAGGGIFKDEWWGVYPLQIGQSPKHTFEFRVASLDPAYTSNSENDPSGFSVWGVYNDEKRNRKILMLSAWEKWLELHGEDIERQVGEKEAAYIQRCKPKWGLVEWVAYECKRHRVHVLLIEDKASGHSVAQEIRRLYSDQDWGVRLYNPGTQDKRARAYSVQPLFANGMIESPASVDDEGNVAFRDWAQKYMTQASSFRGLSGDDDNFVDSMTQALRFMRDQGWAVRSEERQAEETAFMLQNGSRASKRDPIYPA